MDRLSHEFLNVLIQEKVAVNVFLTSGIKLTGTVIAYDDDTILMGGKSTQLLQTHAISTICRQPQKAH